MNNEEFLYECMHKRTELRVKLKHLEMKKKELEHKKTINSINTKLVDLTRILRLAAMQMNSVNIRKSVVFLGIHRDVRAFFDNQYLVLAPQYHGDFRNLLLNMEKLKNLVYNIAQIPYAINFKPIIENFKKEYRLLAYWSLDQMTRAQICKGVPQNINELKQLQREEMSEDEDESALNADPDDNSVQLHAPCIPQFATSSPIPKRTDEAE